MMHHTGWQVDGCILYTYCTYTVMYSENVKRRSIQMEPEGDERKTAKQINSIIIITLSNIMGSHSALDSRIYLSRRNWGHIKLSLHWNLTAKYRNTFCWRTARWIVANEKNCYSIFFIIIIGICMCCVVCQGKSKSKKKTRDPGRGAKPCWSVIDFPALINPSSRNENENEWMHHAICMRRVCATGTVLTATSHRSLLYPTHEWCKFN